MRKPIAYGCLAATAVLIAGCGSSGYGSGSSNAKSTTTQAGGTTTSAIASPSAYGAGAASSAYGAGSASSGGSGTAVVVATKQAKAGTVLAAGPKKLTVYMFEADKGSTSACSGACAGVWPPVTSAAAATASGQAVAADLGTIKRADGTTQVTYKGHPLYFFAKDKDDGDAYGQGLNSFGAGWYVLAPSGNKIDSDSKGGGNDS